MKCIKNIKASKSYDLNEIRRTDDIDAEQKVKSGNWKYIPKEEWKAEVRKLVKKEDIQEQPTQEPTIAEKQLKAKKRGKNKAE
jgi:hypothetical protein